MIDSDFSMPVIAEASPERRSPLASLRRLVRATALGKSAEKCELCAVRLPAEHRHLVDLRTRRLVCSCEACGLLFSSGRSRVYRRVPEGVQSLPGFRVSEAEWENLRIPINLAFFFRAEDALRNERKEDDNKMNGDSSFPEGSIAESGRIVAVYPSPAGPVESLLAREAWQSIARNNPRLEGLQAEVEALLVNRLWGEHLYYILPIDQCYRLNGLVRLHWRGLSGGSEVWDEVARYFDRLKEKACSI
jgi:hypothetical protein